MANPKKPGDEDVVMKDAKKASATPPDVEMKESKLQGKKRFSFKKVLADTLQGRIYLARDRSTNEWVVVKETWKELVKQGKSRDGHSVPENFEKEKEIQMYLSTRPDADSGFVRTLDEWDDENCFYLAMEYCNGGELFDYIRKMHTQGAMARYIQQVQRLPQRPAKTANEWIQRVQHMFRQLVRTVSWMHKHGVCHLDLSLENTMLGDAQKHETKIIDFGLGRQFEKGRFSYKKRVGKTGYMAPEVYAYRTYDPRAADIWSLGVMLFMMLVGAPPYEYPTKQNPAFNFIINGRLRDVLTHWRRLPLVNEDALDLLNKIFVTEKNRISMDGIRNHPFVGLGPEKEAAGQAVANPGQGEHKSDNEDHHMDDKDPASRGGGGSGGSSQTKPNPGGSGTTQTVPGQQYQNDVQTESDFKKIKEKLTTEQAIEYSNSIRPDLPVEELRALHKRIEQEINRLTDLNQQAGSAGSTENPSAEGDSVTDDAKQDVVKRDSCIKDLKLLSRYVQQRLPGNTAGAPQGETDGGSTQTSTVNNNPIS